MAEGKLNSIKSFLPEIAPLVGANIRAVRLKDKLSLLSKGPPEHLHAEGSLYGSLQRVRVDKRPFRSFVESGPEEASVERLKE